MAVKIAQAERALQDLDERAVRLWDRVRIEPIEWAQTQYTGVRPFWVVAILGQCCLCFNPIEMGWGWGRYSNWGEVGTGHCQQDEIQHVIFQTLFAIDEGVNG